MKVYLDYSATSPVKKEVKEAILPYLENDFGNPSSLHSWGQTAKNAVEKSREQVAEFLGCASAEIVFTSGGTESDNLAIRGIIAYRVAHSVPKGVNQKSDKPVHIITSQIEHHAVLRTCEHLEKAGLAEVTYLKPNIDGTITTAQVEKAIKDDTVLISIMYVNNEVGTVQPIREIGKMVEKINKLRIQNEELKSNNTKIHNSALNNSRIFFHTDAVQATEYQNMNVDYLHVDLLSISGHKIGAPKGIGALYIRKNTPVKSIMFGGEQEHQLRAGTENVVGIVALGKATEELRIKNYELRIKKTKELRNYFIDKILKEIPDTELNGSKTDRSPNNANFHFKYIEGESILLNLDLVGIAASSGSACASVSLTPSHVLMAIYNDPQRAHSSIRFTLGTETTKEEIDYTIEKLKEIVKKLRAMSPFGKK